MTMVVAVEGLPLEQVTKQLNKLVNVIKIVELDPEQSVQRELLLVKVKADPQTRSTGAGDRRSSSGPRSSTSPPTR
jgi:acetolactate synthase I/III small subunit